MEFLTDYSLNYRLFVGSLLSGLLLLSSTAVSQDWRLLDSIPFTPPYSVTSDLTGKLYGAQASGSVGQYDARGNRLQVYNPASQEPPLLLPWQLLRVQAYYPYQQILRVLDQNLTEVTSLEAPEIVLGNITLSADQHLWYVSSEWILKKYQPILEETVVASSLQWYVTPQTTVRMLQEYQNRLYIQLDEKVIVMDLFGNYLTSIAISKEAPLIQFRQKELYYALEDKLVFVDLYSRMMREVPLPQFRPSADKTTGKTLVGEKWLYSFRDRNLYIYSGPIDF